MLKTKEEIENWLIEVNIENYTINEDLTVDVDGSVEISFLELDKIPVQFGEVKGDFDCSYNNLINLKFAPKKIGRTFDGTHNMLKSIEGCPEEVGGGFSIQNNDDLEISTLKYFNCIVGGEIGSGFGNDEDFLDVVKQQKIYGEKKELQSFIKPELNGVIQKKRI